MTTEFDALLKTAGVVNMLAHDVAKCAAYNSQYAERVAPLLGKRAKLQAALATVEQDIYKALAQAVGAALQGEHGKRDTTILQKRLEAEVLGKALAEVDAALAPTPQEQRRGRTAERILALEQNLKDDGARVLRLQRKLSELEQHSGKTIYNLSERAELENALRGAQGQVRDGARKLAELQQAGA